MGVMKEKHVATIKLTSYSLKSLEHCQAAIKDALGKMVPEDGFEISIKVKSDYPLTEELRDIQGIITSHRGVNGTITNRTVKELEPDDDAKSWEKSPMGQITINRNETPSA